MRNFLVLVLLVGVAGCGGKNNAGAVPTPSGKPGGTPVKPPDSRPPPGELRMLKGTNFAAFLLDGEQALAKNGVLWDLKTGAEKKLLKILPGMQITDFAFLRDKQRVLTSDIDGWLHLWDLESGDEKKNFGGHSGNVNRVAIAHDWGLAVSGGNTDRKLKLWAIDAGNPPGDLATCPNSISFVGFLAGGKRVLAASGKLILIYDVDQKKEVGRYDDKWNGQIRSVALSAEGKQVLSIDPKQMLILWDAETGSVISEIGSAANSSACVALSPDGKRALSGGNDQLVHVWNVGSKSEIQALKGHSQLLLSVAFSPDGQRALSSAADDTVRLWQLPE